MNEATTVTPERLTTTILLADDDEDSRTIFETLFEFEGFRVLHAADGRTAVKVVREDRPDLVILNLMMPLMSGHQVLAAIRGDPGTSAIPCLLLTGDARHEVMGRAILGGADGFLTKPARPQAVLHFVRQILDEQR